MEVHGNYLVVEDVHVCSVRLSFGFRVRGLGASFSRSRFVVLFNASFICWFLLSAGDVDVHDTFHTPPQAVCTVCTCAHSSTRP